MIHLKQIRPVKFIHNGGWKTGTQLSANADGHDVLTERGIAMVQLSATGEVVWVDADDLQGNTCREDERKAEAALDEDQETLKWLDQFIVSISQYAAVDPQMFGPHLAVATGYRDGTGLEKWR